MLKVGYIGLGLMGKPIAQNIMRAGFPLVVHNRSRAAMDELVKGGAISADNPADVAKQVDIIFTNLPDSPDVEKVALGEKQKRWRSWRAWRVSLRKKKHNRAKEWRGCVLGSFYPSTKIHRRHHLTNRRQSHPLPIPRSLRVLLPNHLLLQRGRLIG